MRVEGQDVVNHVRDLYHLIDMPFPTGSLLSRIILFAGRSLNPFL